MGLPIYACPKEAASRVPEILTAAGIKVTRLGVDGLQGCDQSVHLRLLCSRGLAKNQLIFYSEPTDTELAMHTCWHMFPLFWPTEMRLLRDIRTILEAEGLIEPRGNKTNH
jgi:hypothetical protein